MDGFMVRFMVKSIVKIFRENRIKRRMFPNVGMGFWWSNLWSNDLERAVLSGDLPYFRGLYISVKMEARHTREFAAMPLKVLLGRKLPRNHEMIHRQNTKG